MPRKAEAEEPTMTRPMDPKSMPADSQKEAREVVAQTVYEAASNDADPAWSTLLKADRDAYMTVADHAMQAHMDWLIEAGFRIAPPGTMLRPKCESDARAMILAANDFLSTRSKKALLTSPKLIVPPKGLMQ